MHSPPTSTPPLEYKDFDLWIEAGHIEKHYWRDLWNYRELLFMLAWRDVAVRYKQTVAGATWALLQPFLSMLIMTVIFSRVAGLPSVGSAPYAIMVFAGLLPWQFVSNALANAGQSVVINAGMISKVYFPRVIVPAASVFVSVVDFLISFFILVVLMIWFRFVPTARILALPVFAILAVVVAMGPGLLITALTVRFRDFRFITPFIVQFGMYASPVAYSSEVVRAKLGETGYLIYCLNPVVGVIDGFRWAILGEGAQISVAGSCISLSVAVLLLVAGVVYFRKTERSFADVI